MLHLSRKTILPTMALLACVIILAAIFYIFPHNDTPTIICPKEPADRQVQCWVESIESMIQERGARAAFDVISRQFIHEPSFKQSCNDILHQAGHWTYHYTAHHTIPFVVPPGITLCAHGFDRAFVHALTETTGDFSKAVAFCKDPQLASESLDATAACFHDIGHGTLSFYARSNSRDQKYLISRALDECARISHTSLELDYCAGGVFSEVIRFFQTNQYGITLDKQDPFSFCRIQPAEYKKMCYATTGKPLLLWLANGDFTKAASFIKAIDEDEYAAVAMDALANAIAMQNITKGKNPTDYSNDILFCRTVLNRLHLPCIAGLGIELLTHSSPADALTFCRLPMMTEQEHDACFNRVAPNIGQWISQKDIKHICASLPEKYREECSR